MRSQAFREGPCALRFVADPVALLGRIDRKVKEESILDEPNPRRRRSRRKGKKARKVARRKATPGGNGDGEENELPVAEATSSLRGSPRNLTTHGILALELGPIPQS
jgi:hypothetical protein